MKFQMNLIFVFNDFYFTKQIFQCIYTESHCDNHYHVLPCELSALQFDIKII